MNNSIIEDVSNELGAFLEPIDEDITTVILTDYTNAMVEYFEKEMAENGEAKLKLPHMNLEVAYREGGDGGNNNIKAKYNKNFLEALNDETVIPDVSEVDDKFIDIFMNHLREKGQRIAFTEENTSWMTGQLSRILADQGRKNAREGKECELDWGYGTHVFSMKDGEISVRFVASKHLKHAQKDDSAYKA